MTTNTISMGACLGLLRPGISVFLAGASGEPTAFLDALNQAPEHAKGVHFIGSFVPGASAFDPRRLDPTASATTFFFSDPFYQAFAEKRVRLMPLPYSTIDRYIRTRARIDVAIVQVSPPDRNGRCSLGPTGEFTPGGLGRASLRIALVNDRAPALPGARSIPITEFDHVVECSHALSTMDTGSVGADLERLARHVVAEIADGSTLQVGLGKPPAAITAALRARRDLRVFSGLVSDPILGLIDSGSLAPTEIVAGSIFGTERLYDAVRDNPLFRIEPVEVTHDLARIAGFPNFVSVNSALEVDLYGQINSEMLGLRAISGVGGAADYVRGARMSPGGKSIVALLSSVQKGTVSRIVPSLQPGAPVSVARCDVDCVATEFGMVSLTDLSVDERAEALISISAPQFRESLAASWSVTRRNMIGAPAS